VEEVIREAIRSADRYEMRGLKRWDFFYLFERTRRWAAATQAGKPGFSVTPFLTPGYVQEAFAYPEHDKTDNPFHRHILRTLQPAWSSIPFASEITLPAGQKGPSQEQQESLLRATWQTAGRRRFYDTHQYWQEVGRPILSEALAAAGWWSEIFDPKLTHDSWAKEPDELAVICLLPEAITSALPPAGI
jgi:hypothetical protein